MNRRRASMIFLLFAFALSACDKSPSQAPQATSAAPGAVVKLVYIPKNTGNPYFDPLIAGFKKAAEETGCQFATVAPDSADATSQLPLIKDQIQQGVSVIAISPNSPDALNPVFEEAMQKGISVVTVDSDLTGNEKYRNVGVLTVDPATVGSSQVELLGSLIGYKGKFAILSATTDAPNQNAWIVVMKKTLQTDPKYKDMQLVETVYGNDEPQKSLTEAEALLTKYPDLRGIIAPTTVGVAAAAQAVESAKKADQVKVTGLGTPKQMRRFIKNGTVDAFALWSPYDEGYLAGQISAQLAKRTLDPGAGLKFQAGTLGERQFRDNNVVITGPPVVFNKDNIDKFDF
ncbi:MAG TPA: substrate-binding domain-containing protein [Tepidisphaeraceae bacterium]|jgi:rhamnose transport system substrate-binding protein